MNCIFFLVQGFFYKKQKFFNARITFLFLHAYTIHYYTYIYKNINYAKTNLVKHHKAL